MTSCHRVSARVQRLVTSCHRVSARVQRLVTRCHRVSARVQRLVFKVQCLSNGWLLCLSKSKDPHSNVHLFYCSNVLLFKCSIVQMFHCSNVFLINFLILTINLLNKSLTVFITLMHLDQSAKQSSKRAMGRIALNRA